MRGGVVGGSGPGDNAPMNQLSTRLRKPSGRPLRIFVIVLIMVLVVEYAVMLLLPLLPGVLRGAGREALIDSVLLTVVLAPALWLVVARPLQQLSASRGQLLGQLFDDQEQERARLAHDLHDELGQHLTAILIGLRTVEEAPDLAQARERARGASEAAAASLDKVRRIARGLRPTVLEDLGLSPAVERICEEFRSPGGVAVELTMELVPGERFSPQVEMCVFRVLQESLTNAVRHGSPRSVRVLLSRGPYGVSLTVSDDGRGFELSEKVGSSFGLHGMRERVELLDGRWEVRSSPGHGTTIHASIPLVPAPS